MYDEEEQFKDDSYKDGKYFRIKRNKNGMCKFLNEQKRCGIYEKRPLECRIYPYVFSYENNELQLKLHDGCPQKEKSTKPEIPEHIKQSPNDWWSEWGNLSI
jgi:Fe-S-cluster containining protein